MAMARVFTTTFVLGFGSSCSSGLLHRQRSRLFSSCSSRFSMSLKAGIVGLPNVGKSTLFNAVVENGKAQAANFPFCTIEPNVGIVAVPDPRLDVLSGLSKSQRAVPASIEFVDIAGLVKGASQGEGLGNKFLSHIREVDSILQAGLKPNGFFVLKENVASKGFILDKDDHSVTRSDSYFKELFGQCGLYVYSTKDQEGLPEELFRVKMYALVTSKPKR